MAQGVKVKVSTSPWTCVATAVMEVYTGTYYSLYIGGVNPLKVYPLRSYFNDCKMLLITAYIYVCYRYVNLLLLFRICIASFGLDLIRGATIVGCLTLHRVIPLWSIIHLNLTHLTSSLTPLTPIRLISWWKYYLN